MPLAARIVAHPFCQCNAGVPPLFAPLVSRRTEQLSAGLCDEWSESGPAPSERGYVKRKRDRAGPSGASRRPAHSTKGAQEPPFRGKISIAKAVVLPRNLFLPAETARNASRKRS